MESFWERMGMPKLLVSSVTEEPLPQRRRRVRSHKIESDPSDEIVIHIRLLFLEMI